MSQQNLIAPPELEQADYLRQRLSPQPGDEFYLHLEDLRLALESALPPAGARVLDYGCGGSPYRSLFRTSLYHRADIPGLPGLDFVFGEDSRISAPDGAYDCVLSTQVLEHVKHVDIYLRECRRLLHRDGVLLVTTHGTFHDHGCPHDYWRWTADGLREHLTRSGFKVERLHKLTTGPRALLTLNQQFQPRLLVRERGLAAWVLRVNRLIYSRLPRRKLDALADREFPHCRVVDPGAPGHELYIALFAVAKPT